MDRRVRVEPRIDFFQCLGTDVSRLITNFLDDEGDLVRFTAVSRFWREYAIANGLAKQASLKVFPQLGNIVRVVDASEGTNVPTEWEILERDHKVYIALLHAVARSKSLPQDCIDHLRIQSIVNTLNPRNRLPMGASYWSSIGHLDPEVPETLTYKIRDGIWSIVEVDIKLFLACFERDNPIYAARSVQFRFGMPNGPKPPNKAGTSSRTDLPEILWTYTSPEFPMLQANCFQPFKMPKPVLCFGGYFQIELLGRVQRQEVDDLFDLCVSHVSVKGRPLFPAFNIERVEPDGKSVLSYDPNERAAILEVDPGDDDDDDYRIDRHMDERMFGRLRMHLLGKIV